MPNPVQLESFTSGAETAVDVAGIERQLQELWQLAAASDPDPARQMITRACRFSLVAMTDAEPARDRATEIISRLTSTHPCRAIVILADPEAGPAELSAGITAHCLSRPARSP